MNRDFRYNLVAGPVTTGYTARLTFTGTVGDKYLVLANEAIGRATDAFQAGVEDLSIGGPYIYSRNIQPIDPTPLDMICTPSFFPYTITQSGANNFDLALGADYLNLPTSITKRGCAVAAFKMNNLDFTNDDYANQVFTSSSTSYVDVDGTSKTFTVDVAGYYWILASAAVGKSETTANFNVRLNVDGTSYADATMRVNTATNRQWPWCAQKLLLLSAGSHTMKLEAKAVTTGSVSVAQGSLVALRCDLLPRVVSEEDVADLSTSSISYIDKLSLYPKLVAKPTLIVATNLYKRNTGHDCSARTQLDGVDMCESYTQCVTAVHEYSHCAITCLTPSAGHHTVLQQFRREADGISKAVCADAVSVVAQMEDNVTAQIFGGEIYQVA